MPFEKMLENIYQKRKNDIYVLQGVYRWIRAYLKSSVSDVGIPKNGNCCTYVTPRHRLVPTGLYPVIHSATNSRFIRCLIGCPAFVHVGITPH